jgi:hypothetical protein
MDGISWTDLDKDEQRTIAMLAEGVKNPPLPLKSLDNLRYLAFNPYSGPYTGVRSDRSPALRDLLDCRQRHGLFDIVGVWDRRFRFFQLGQAVLFIGRVPSF